MKKKHLLLIHTGGTISMKENNETGSVAPDGHNPMADIVDIPGISASFTVMEPFQVPSPHITIEHMNRLRKLIEETDADGVVITHGTDTMEETAYFLHITLSVSVPVVLTGAMRSSNEISSDGLANFIAAIKTALHPEAQGKGVLLVMNDTIHSAQFVTKSHSGNVSSFQSTDAGPIGTITKSGARFFSTPLLEPALPAQHFSSFVPLLKAYAGMDSTLIEAMNFCDGLVIEALGQGNLPPAAAEAVIKLIKSGVPVVIATRCSGGVVDPVYSYEGGGAHLKKAGALFAGSLNGPKARIKLIAALGSGQKQSLQQLFD